MSRRHFILPWHGMGRYRAGFTLVELMVAMLLGLIVIAGVASVFLANLRSYHSNAALSDVQSNARIAFELMARDIRQAGLTGCDSTNGRVANVLNNGPNKTATPDWWANWGNTVHGYGGKNQNGDAVDQVDPAVSIGTGTGDRVANTDSLEILGAIGAGVSIYSDTEPDATFTLNGKSPNLQTGDVILVCDPDHSVLVQVSSYDGNVTVDHSTGGVSPGNCSKGLGYGSDCDGGDGNVYTFGRNSRVSRLAAHDWYIGNNPAGGRSLYRIALTNNAGALSTTAQEMVRNVTDMQILYHLGNDDKFIAADAVGSWAAVNAVRITYTLQSTDQRAGTDAQPLTRTFTSTTTIRNRVN